MSRKIENVVTYTQYSASWGAHVESTIWIQRPYALTMLGAQRILRKTHPFANVTRLQHLTR